MTTVKRFFDKFSTEYEAQGRRNYLFYRWLIAAIVGQIDKKECEILDLGTGTGELLLRVAIRFPQSYIVGLDVSVPVIKEAKKKAAKMRINNIGLVVSSVEKAKIRKIDFAVSCLVFHHIKDKEQVISEICRVLPKKGKLVIGDWFKPCKKYREEVEKLRSKKPQKTKEFDKSWPQALKAMSREYRENHPKEYPVCPHRLKEIIKDAGFRKQRVVKSPLANFAIVIGEK